MHRERHVLSLLAALAMGIGLSIAPAAAGMSQDLADCTAADRKSSVNACTRVMSSGRLPRSQFYIGHFNRGWANFHMGRLDAALADFDKAVSFNPSYADSYFSRAVIQHERGAREQSLADLDRYLAKKGESVHAYLNRAQIFRARGENDRAFAELQRAGALDPADGKVFAQRAIVLSELGESEPARQDADKAVAAAPDEASAYYARAFVAMHGKDYAAARTDIDKAIALKQRFPQAHVLKGELEEQAGEASSAVASYRRAIEISSKSIDARRTQDAARKRLDALGEPPARVAATAATSPKPEPDPPAEPGACRRFIPAAEATVAVACPD